MLQQKLEQSRLELDEFKDFTSKMESNLREKELENQRLIKKVEEAQSELTCEKQSGANWRGCGDPTIRKITKEFPYHSLKRLKRSNRR